MTRLPTFSRILLWTRPPRRETSDRLRAAGHIAPVVLAAILFCDAAAAFSRIEPSEGTETLNRDGIIAVPLPSLDPSAEPAPDDDDPAPALSDPPPAAPSPSDAAPLEPANPRSGSGDRTAPAGPVRPSDAGPQPLPAAPADSRDRGARSEAVPLTSRIAHGETGLPDPVRDLRRKLMEIAASGDVEKLRPYLEPGKDGTVLSFGAAPEDPIAFLKSSSGDGEGVELMAILLEVLEAGHAVVEPGEDTEIFVWPYFTQTNLHELTKPQLVELFEIVTAGDYESMLDFGAYNFYRVGISPEGRLEFFVAGD